MTVHVFRGPTITATEVRRFLPDAVVRPPVQHGDLPRLRLGPDDTVVIIDGAFHQRAAVRHKEILAALDAGARVLGSSSIGALRAAELDVFGMTGVGSVYNMYKTGVTDADADVAVTHTLEGTALSVALVDVIGLTTEASQDGAITSAEAASIVDHMRLVHYFHRSWAALGSRDAHVDGDVVARFTAWRANNPHRHGPKYDDAVAVLTAVAAGAAPAEVKWDGWRDAPWRNDYIDEWEARHTPCAAHDPVPLLAEIQHQQIHDPAMPGRWRRYVLSWVAGLRPDHDLTVTELEKRALRAAAAKGLHPALLSTKHRAYWLTAAESETLTAEEALLRILVRGTGLGSTSPLLPRDHDTDMGLLNPDWDAAVVADAYRVNARARQRGVKLDELDPTAIREYLSLLWQVRPATESNMVAAARDRGFRHIDGAVDICRPFILATVGERLWEHLGRR